MSVTRTLVICAAAAASFAAGVLWTRMHDTVPQPKEAAPAHEAGVLRFPAGSPQLAFVVASTVASEPVPLAEPLNARVVYGESYTARVSSPVAGRIVALPAQVGDVVRAGAPLVTIDAPDLGAAQADLAKARADETRKELALRRARELFGGEVLPKKDLESAEADLALSKAESARAALRLANLNPRRAPLDGQHMLLASPLAGVIAERRANPGMEVRPDLPDPLFVVTDLAHLQVVVDLPEHYLPKVRVGQPVSAEVDAWPGKRFSGRVERIAPGVDPATRRVQVRCTVVNPEGELRPDMYARVTLLADENRRAVRVPNSSLVTEGLYSYVFVEREPGVFVKRKVALAVQDREYSYVSEGLAENEKAVTRGALLLNSELASGG
ncbi:MAG: efflux RND transporter periplasmic adaptor subunit [Proteobacteria bacterium]|nr:efflux RND transporter periplasmic adaptor subunit [Pseudomonadota bacterium]